MNEKNVIVTAYEISTAANGYIVRPSRYWDDRSTGRLLDELYVFETLTGALDFLKQRFETTVLEQA